MPIPPPPDDIDMPTRHERRVLGRTSPTRAVEITQGVLSIMGLMLAVIFFSDVLSLAPLPPYVVAALSGGFCLAVVDVAACSFGGRPRRVLPTVIVLIGGGVTLVAIALAALPL